MHLECISELVDVMRLVRPSPDTSPEDFLCSMRDRSWDFSGNGRVVLQVILDNTCTMGSCTVVLKDECVPMAMSVRHYNSLSEIAFVLEPSDILLADVEFCPPGHSNSSPNNDTSISIEVVCNHGWRMVTFPTSKPNPWPPIIKIENEFRLNDITLDATVHLLRSQRHTFLAW